MSDFEGRLARKVRLDPQAVMVDLAIEGRQELLELQVQTVSHRLSTVRLSSKSSPSNWPSRCRTSLPNQSSRSVAQCESVSSP